jgi:CRISPR-associated protein Csm4
MDAKAYHLQGRSGFHFGLRGVGIEATSVHAHSDTLFSAFCHALRQQFDQATLQDFLNAYQTEEPPLLLSSGFPYVLERSEEEVDWTLPGGVEPQQVVRFFPRPLTWPTCVPDLPDERKSVKRIQWVSEWLFRAWVNGDDLSVHCKERTLLQGQQVWVTDMELQSVAGWRDPESDEIRLWAEDDVPRVTVDRRRSTSNVYQAGLIRFQPGGGLWFLAYWREDWRARGETALQSLSDAGIGGERSSGYGRFTLHGPHAVPALPEPVPGERFLTLSLYYPRPEELSAVLRDQKVSYSLRVRRGWMSSPEAVADPSAGIVRGTALRRKSVRMFAEGSLLYWPEGRRTLGALADVTPDAFDPAHGGHTVWRYGYALPVRYRGGG